jgi:ABC-type lipoprotein release transport system permease subunit
MLHLARIPIGYTIRNLWARRLTSALTTGGISLVVFVFAAVLMLSNGVRETMVTTGRDDNAIVIRKSSQTELTSAIDRGAASILRTFPEVAMLGGGQPGAETIAGERPFAAGERPFAAGERPFAAGELVVIINLRKHGSNDLGNVVVRGSSAIGMRLRAQVAIAEGRMFRQGSSEIIVGSAIHKRFQGTGIGRRLRFGGQEWVVVGIFDAGGSAFDSEIWGDVEQLCPAFGRPVFSSLTVRLTGAGAFDAFAARLAADPRLQQLETKRESVFYTEQSQMMSLFISVLGMVITVMFSIGAIIGAMITMYAAVAHRTTEIGTLRALGFRRSSVLAAFLVESLLISLVGGAAGLLIASCLQFVTISTVNWGSFSELAFGFALSPDIVLNTMLFSVGMGLVGGFLPAVRASRMDIVAALRSA